MSEATSGTDMRSQPSHLSLSEMPSRMSLRSCGLRMLTPSCIDGGYDYDLATRGARVVQITAQKSKGAGDPKRDAGNAGCAVQPQSRVQR